MKNFKKKETYLMTLFFTVIISLIFTSCNQNTQSENVAVTQSENQVVITEQDVLEAQKAWGEGIVKIGKVFTDNGDYKSAATEHLNNFYNPKFTFCPFDPVYFPMAKAT
jgi:hypothetical protein